MSASTPQKRKKRYNPYRYQGKLHKKNETNKLKWWEEWLFPSRKYRNLTTIPENVSNDELFAKMYTTTELSKFQSTNEFFRRILTKHQENKYKIGKHLFVPNFFTYLTGSFYYMWNGLYLGMTLTYLLSMLFIMFVLVPLSKVMPVYGFYTLIIMNVICGLCANLFFVRKYGKILRKTIRKVRRERLNTYKNEPYIKYVVKKKMTGYRIWNLMVSTAMAFLLFYYSTGVFIWFETDGITLSEAFSRVGMTLNMLQTGHIPH